MGKLERPRSDDNAVTCLREIFSFSESARDGVRNLLTTVCSRSTRCPSSLTLASHSAAFLAPHHELRRRRAAWRKAGGCAPILARLSIMPHVAPKHCAIRVIFSKCEIMPPGV
jgi:hypothetical protein